MAADPVTLPDTLADFLDRLGNIATSRVRARPPLGKATEKDLIDANARRTGLFELIDGTLVEKAHGFKESCVSGEILGEVGAFVDAHDLGVLTGATGLLRLRKGVVRSPDLAFVHWDRFPGRKIPRVEIPTLAPDLAVDVLRLGNTPGEMHRKRQDFFRAGTRLMWIVDTDQRSATAYTTPDVPDVVIDQDGALDGGAVLPGFTLPLAPLFYILSPETRPRRNKNS